jgi:hypothetical protein
LWEKDGNVLAVETFHAEKYFLSYLGIFWNEGDSDIWSAYWFYKSEGYHYHPTAIFSEYLTTNTKIIRSKLTTSQVTRESADHLATSGHGHPHLRRKLQREILSIPTHPNTHSYKDLIIQISNQKGSKELRFAK